MTDGSQTQRYSPELGEKHGDKINSYAQVEMLIIQWAEARKIIPNARPQAQLNKALEELAELFKAESQNRLEDIKDGVGDVVVCLINYCALRDIDLVRCLIGAYHEIKDRKGTLMPDGTFVKEEAKAPMPEETLQRLREGVDRAQAKFNQERKQAMLDAMRTGTGIAMVTVDPNAGPLMNRIAPDEIYLGSKVFREDPETGHTEAKSYSALTEAEKLDHDARVMAEGLPTASWEPLS